MPAPADNTSQVFGHTADGRQVTRFGIGRAPGPVVEVLDLGATVHRLEVTGGDGRRRNVALGHPTAQDYLDSTDYIGGTIGRYANRIARGRFRLDDKECVVGAGDDGNHLHGGPDGFHRRTWELVEHGPSSVVLRMTSPDGDQGFPGELVATARFTVTDNALRLQLSARTDRATVVNMTCHAYLNLNGEDSGAIDGHVLTIDAEEYTPVDLAGIPLGGHAGVSGTPLDFRQPSAIGPRLRAGHPHIDERGGIDHNFVVRGEGVRRAAALISTASRTRMELWTDQPGLQVYTGNNLDSPRSSPAGGRYRRGDGIALEPQLFPDSPNHPEWPSPVLTQDQTYRATLEYRFSAAP